jgi:hypothetical protein
MISRALGRCYAILVLATMEMEPETAGGVFR